MQEKATLWIRMSHIFCVFVFPSLDTKWKHSQVDLGRISACPEKVIDKDTEFHSTKMISEERFQMKINLCQEINNKESYLFPTVVLTLRGT